MKEKEKMLVFCLSHQIQGSALIANLAMEYNIESIPCLAFKFMGTEIINILN